MLRSVFLLSAGILISGILLPLSTLAADEQSAVDIDLITPDSPKAAALDPELDAMMTPDYSAESFR